MDLIFKTLKEHEKNLDTLVSQLDENLNHSSFSEKSTSQEDSKFKIILKKWPEFRFLCQNSDLVTFNLDNKQIHITSIKNGNYYYYNELIPKMNNKISKLKNCSIKNESKKNGKSKKLSSTNTNEDTSYNNIKIWLANELNVEKVSIVVGEITN